jgi:5-methylcytosine-specific restriction endonuclease McrA
MGLAFPKPRPRIFDKRDAAREKQRIQRSVYAKVSERDGRQCRCCGRKDSLHHHHIVYRSRLGEDSTANIVLLCAFCHSLEHVARQLTIIGTNADSVKLRFEIHEAAVVEIFGNRTMPRQVRIVTGRRA